MEWVKLKAHLLENGSARVEGAPIDAYLGQSTAGPGAGGSGSAFFTRGEGRVRLSIQEDSPIVLLHRGEGVVTLAVDGETVEGTLEKVGLHCPRQAYVTINERCIHRCKYCMVPFQQGRMKTVEELEAHIRAIQNRIDAIAITSGVAANEGEEEKVTLSLVRRIRHLGIPIGVSIYPREETPGLLHVEGVEEVKFNLETATDHLFTRMCPGLDRDLIWRILDRSVTLFGENHVFSNVIIGLGETDSEMETCIEDLADRGVIPVLRPLQPAAAVAHYPRVSAGRLLSLCEREEAILKTAGLEPLEARTMCLACTGCDLTPGRDT
ncbi:MAG: radical SAM protein [Methanomicrobiales archaeon]|nr:radical SAM protein [Methanomicrobiales archaeon]